MCRDHQGWWRGIGRVGSTVWKHHLAHDENAVLGCLVWIDGDWLQDAIRVTTVSLLSGAAVEAPERELIEGREGVEFLDAILSAEVWERECIRPTRCNPI